MDSEEADIKVNIAAHLKDFMSDPQLWVVMAGTVPGHFMGSG